VAYLGELVGESKEIQDVRRLIKRVAESPARAVLVYGETGTGKGLVSRMIHEQSPRSRKRFIDINCSAIPESLVESELFGHEKGAFTGATARKTGLIEAADGGTVLLDELRELDHVVQAKLLTLLDNQRFRPIGGIRDVEVDVRFIGATNRILYRDVQEGRFRDDLYYRLQVAAVNVPPLRERGDDCLILMAHFIRKLNARYGREVKGWEPAVAEVFRAHRWPGNVRELENLLERIFVLEDDNQVLARHIPPRIMREVEHGPGPAEGEGATAAGYAGLSFQDATAAFQTRLLQDALRHHGGNLAAAAEALGMTRHALRHHMIKLGLR
jgi:two-component system, NtrC family, response regulator AtoC